MTIRCTLVAAALLLISVAGQSTLPELPSGCYYTTSVFTFGPGSFSFSSMTMPSTTITATSTVTLGPSGSSSLASTLSTNGDAEPTSQSPGTTSTPSAGFTSSAGSGSSSTGVGSSASSLATGTTGPSVSSSFLPQSSSFTSSSSFPSAPVLSTTSIPGSISFTTSSAPTTSSPTGPPPDIQPGDEFNIAVNVGGQKTKRAIFYIAFDPDGVTILVASKDEAAVFVLDEAGNLISGGLYVGTSSSVGTTALQLFSDPPVSPFFWSVEEGVVSFGFASFCVTATDQTFVVYDDTPAQGCSEVQFAGDPVPAEVSTTMSMSCTTSHASSSSATTVRTSSTTLRPSASSASSASDVIPTQRPSSSTQSSSRIQSSPSSSSTLTTTRSASRTSTPSPSAPSLTPTSTPGLPSASTSITTSRSTSASSGATSPSSSNASSTASPTTGSLSSSSSRSSSVVTTFSTSRTSSRTSSTASTSTSAVPQVLKRGLAYGNVSSLNFYTPPSQVSWAYNYYSLPNDSTSANAENKGPYPPAANPNMVFYPLLFNDNPNLLNVWEANVNFSITHYKTDAVMSFNEPDLCVDGSSCMTVARAITAYERYIQPLAARGIRLAAPSITNTERGFLWLTEFMGNATARNLTVDIINLHWYASPYTPDYFEEYFTEKHEQFGRRPIWITEYGMDQFYVEPAILQFMRNSTYWVQQQPWIEKTCWFGNYKGNLMNADASALSGRGQIWNSYKGNGYVYGYTKRDVGDGDVDGDGAEVERPEDIATPENIAAFKNLQMEESFGKDWLQLVRGEISVEEYAGREAAVS